MSLSRQKLISDTQNVGSMACNSFKRIWGIACNMASFIAASGSDQARIA